jgi:hypothetical protein
MSNELTRSQIIDLLSAAMSYDNRNVSDAHIYAWREASRRGRWSYEDALEALHDHYAESTQYVMPAHITERIRTMRRQRFETETAALESGEVNIASAEKVRRWVAEIAARLGMPEDSESATARRTRRCEWCGAQPGDRCVNLATHRPLKGGTSHPIRLESPAGG